MDPSRSQNAKNSKARWSVNHAAKSTIARLLSSRRFRNVTNSFKTRAERPFPVCVLSPVDPRDAV
jgi:hypothetical protein